MSSEKKIPKAILFDLDGTLLDTAADLGLALNRVLQARKKSPVDQARIRPEAGRGCKGLLKLGLDMDDNHPEYQTICEELLNYYQQHLLDNTKLFPGMEEVLMRLDFAKTPWGIVTNKPTRFTSELIAGLQLNHRAKCVVSGDTLNKRKPHPEPLLHACDLLQVSPSECIYVGDSEVDAIASEAAGMPILVAMYGYISQSENPSRWKADGYIQHPKEILIRLSLQRK